MLSTWFWSGLIALLLPAVVGSAGDGLSAWIRRPGVPIRHDVFQQSRISGWLRRVTSRGAAGSDGVFASPSPYSAPSSLINMSTSATASFSKPSPVSGLYAAGSGAATEVRPSSRSSAGPAPTPARAQRSSRSGQSDRSIFRKIVDSQTTDSSAPLVADDVVWSDMRRDAEMECRKVRTAVDMLMVGHSSFKEPLLSSFMSSAILNHRSLEAAVAFHMANKLATPTLIGTQIQSLFMQCFEDNPSFSRLIRSDIMAVMDRDPACRSYLDALLYFKGFQALQTHRVAHWLWKKGRDTLAFYLQSQVNRLFQIDIHPAASIGEGVFIDHGTGVVIGETAVVGNNVSMLHMVTLGGSGKKHVDRHPKIGDGVLLGAGSTILGNVKVGSKSLVGACSLVLEDVPPNSVAVGVPAKVVGQTVDPAQSMQQVDAVSPPAWLDDDGMLDFVI